MKATILVVEDHRDTLDAMQQLLSLSGYHVLVAESLAEARNALQISKIDLLICDISLSDGNGLDLLKETSVKGIVMSGWGLEEDLKATLAAGAHCHLLKPVDMLKLQGMISCLLPIQGE